MEAVIPIKPTGDGVDPKNTLKIVIFPKMVKGLVV